MSWGKIKLSSFLKPCGNRFKPNSDEIINLKRIDKINFEGKIFLSNTLSNTDMIRIKNGDLIISGINVYKGAVAIYEGEEDVAATIHYSNYEYDPEQIDIEFFKIFLKSTEFLQAIKEQVPGGIKTEIKPKHLLPIEVVIPDISEQRTIVKNYKSFKVMQSSLANEINNQNNLVSKLRQAFLREAMQGKLVPQNPNDEPASEFLKKIKEEKARLIEEGRIKKEKDLPPIKYEEISFTFNDELIFVRLNEICNIIKGNIGIKKAMPGDYPLVTLAEERLSHQEYFFDCKAVVIPIISSAGHGKAEMKRMHYQEGKFSVGNILCVVYPFNNNFFNARFLFEYLNFYKHQFFVKKMRGAANVSLSIQAIGSTPIPLIPISTQYKFENLMKFCDQLEQNINTTKEQSDLLLQSVLREALQPNEEIN